MCLGNVAVTVFTLRRSCYRSIYSIYENTFESRGGKITIIDWLVFGFEAVVYRTSSVLNTGFKLVVVGNFLLIDNKMIFFEIITG